MDSIVTRSTEIDRILSQWLREYDRSINRDLSQQNNQQLLLRNIERILDGFLDELLSRYRAGELEASHREQLIEQLQAVPEIFLTRVLNKHRTSCALSNFPEEHNPTGEYLQQVIAATEIRWSAFWQAL